MADILVCCVDCWYFQFLTSIGLFLLVGARSLGGSGTQDLSSHMKVNSSSSEPNQNLLGDRLWFFIATITKLPLTGWLKIKHILISCCCQFYWVMVRMSARVKVQSGLVPSRGSEEKIHFLVFFRLQGPLVFLSLLLHPQGIRLQSLLPLLTPSPFRQPSLRLSPSYKMTFRAHQIIQDSIFSSEEP